MGADYQANTAPSITGTRNMTMSNARIGRFATAMVLAGLAVASAGCVRLGGRPPAQLLALTPEANIPDGASATGTNAHAIAVAEPDADARLAVLRVAVTVDASRVAYLKGAQWVERPSRQFQHLLAESLRATPGRLVIESDAVRAGDRLSGRLIDMGYDAASRSAVVRFEAVRQISGGPVETRRFVATISGIDGRIESVAPALNQAANSVAKAVAAWMN